MTPKTIEHFARIICEECGPKFLDKDQYDKQMRQPNKGWRCPQCHCYPCDWDDEHFEQKLT